MALKNAWMKAALFLGLLSMLLTACGGNNDGGGSGTNGNGGNGGTDGQSADVKTDVTFFASPGTDIVDIKTNWFTTYVEDNFNLKIKWNTVPTSDVATKQSLLLGSGNYPEVFWSGNFTPSDILKYSKQGILVPLNDYIDKYAPNLQKAIDTLPGLKDVVTSPDGNIYALPGFNFCQHCYWGSKMWINTGMLDKYGLQMPTTTDEFEQVMQVFKDNGVIPLTGAKDGYDPTTFLMNAFVYNDGTSYFDVQDGKLQFAATEDGWKKGLAYMGDLYSKGLLDKQAFSQSQDVLKQLAAQNKVGAIASLYSGAFLDTSSPYYSQWRSVPPLKGPDGVQLAAFSGNQPRNLTFAMTKKSTEAQKINLMKLINFIYTPEGTEMLDFGPEGKFWTKAESGVKGLNGEQALFITQSDKFYSAGAKQNEGWNQMGPIFQSETWRNGFVEASPPFSPNGLESLLLLETMKNYAGHQPKQVYPGAVWIDPADYQQYVLYQTNINQFVKQWMSQFIIGNKSFDKDWDTYVKGVEGLGLDPYMKMAQSAMKQPFDTTSFQSDPKTIAFLESLK